MENTCVVCDAIIPEGRHVCPNCMEGFVPDERISKVKNEETDKQINAHCPWYLGRWKVSDDCDKTCPITEENRDTSMCPECYYDDFD